jgi:hypothetical protein
VRWLLFGVQRFITTFAQGKAVMNHRIPKREFA